MPEINTVEHWNEKYEKWTEDYVTSHRELYEFVMPYLSGDVLDMGCGVCELGRNDHYAGIDISSVAIAKGKARFPGADLRVGNMLACPWPDKSFDTILMLSVIEHFANPLPVLWEAQRLCRGRIVAGLAWRSRGGEHYWPHWDARKTVDVLGQVGEVVEYRLLPNFVYPKWPLAIVEVS